MHGALTSHVMNQPDKLKEIYGWLTNQDTQEGFERGYGA
jgi:hypothetical protein